MTSGTLGKGGARAARLLLTLGLAGSALTLAGHGSPSTVRAVSSPVTFGRATTVSVGQEGFEPDLRIDSNDTLYSSVPNGFATTVSFMWRSLDHGHSFKLVPNSSPDGTGKLITTCVGGGDTEEAIDNHNRLYFNDLQGLTNFSTSRSDDQGKTFLTSCAGTPTNAGVDRQWYAVVYPSYPQYNSDQVNDPVTGTGHVFLAYDQVAQSKCVGGPVGNNELVMTESPPAGTPQSAATSGIEFGAQAPISCDEGIMGNDEISPRTVPSGNASDPGIPGSHYIFVVHDTADLASVMMGRCEQVPVATDPSGLQCVDKPVYNTGANKRPIVVGQNFVTMAVDTAGNLYAAWAQAPTTAVGGNPNGPSHIMLSYSTDNGDTWSTPVQVSQGCSGGPSTCTGTQTNTDVLPWITAGSPGRVDVVWYGTTQDKNPSGAYGSDTLTNGDWKLYMAQSLNADTAAPTFSLLNPTPKIIHRGSIQVLPGQSGDRTNGDFLNVRTGLNGEANITYVDSANDTDLGQDFFLRQNGGPSLYSQVGTVPAFSAPTGGVADDPCDTSHPDDAALDANGAVVSQCGTNLDITSSSVALDPADSSKLRVTMTVANLSSLAAPTTAGGPVVDWLTAWHLPCAYNATTCPYDGHVWFAYMESVNGAAPTFWDGHSSAQTSYTTYPGMHQIAAGSSTGQCSATVTTNCYNPSTGKIVIDVPLADVGSPSTGTTLYSVTASTLTQQSSGSTTSTACTGPVGTVSCGVLFNTIDSAPAYDAQTATPTRAALSAAWAVRSGHATVLRWESDGRGLLGFRVYGNGHVLLSRKLIPARAGVHVYTFRTERPALRRVWIAAIARDGTVTQTGPIAVH